MAADWLISWVTDDQSDDGSEEDESDFEDGSDEEGKWSEMARPEPAAAAAAAAPNLVPHQGGTYPDSPVRLDTPSERYPKKRRVL